MVQVSKVSFEYVDFHAKMSLIFYPAFGNSIAKRTLVIIKTIIDDIDDLLGLVTL